MRASRAGVSMLFVLLACDPGTPRRAGLPEETESVPEGADAPAPNWAWGRCASEFGEGLPPGFLRIDGRALAVVAPGDETCARPNGSHAVVQVVVQDAVYRMVINVKSDRAPSGSGVSWLERRFPRVGPAWK